MSRLSSKQCRKNSRFRQGFEDDEDGQTMENRTQSSLSFTIGLTWRLWRNCKASRRPKYTEKNDKSRVRKPLYFHANKSTMQCVKRIVPACKSISNYFKHNVNAIIQYCNHSKVPRYHGVNLRLHGLKTMNLASFTKLCLSIIQFK